jgi:4-amino-4-deoxy-L-arabinose transferase-like glycosyltransferase
MIGEVATSAPTPNRILFVILPLVMALLVPLLVYQGVILEGDDVLYARLAVDLASGKPTFGINPHPHRLGFIVPLAALYFVFGVHDWTTMAFPLICTWLTIFVAAYAAYRFYGRTAYAWAALFCGLNPILFRHGSVGMPDIPAGLFYGVFVVGWLLLVTDRTRHRRLCAIVTGLACAWSMATRISTAPMIIVTLLGFLILGWRGSTLRKFPLLSFLTGGCLVGIPYLLFLWWCTGTPFYFIRAAQEGHNVAGAPWLRSMHGIHFWIRISGLSILRASVEGFLFATFPILAAMAMVWHNSPWTETRTINNHLLLAILAPLLILSHFSTSFAHWNPIFRHFVSIGLFQKQFVDNDGCWSIHHCIFLVTAIA